MSGNTGPSRSLYLEFRASGLRLRGEEDSYGGVLDYGIVLEGLNSLPQARAKSVRWCVRHNEDDLVRVLLDRRDPDLDAIRKEGNR